MCYYPNTFCVHVGLTNVSGISLVLPQRLVGRESPLACTAAEWFVECPAMLLECVRTAKLLVAFVALDIAVMLFERLLAEKGPVARVALVRHAETTS